MPVFNESDMKSLFFHLEEVNARMDSLMLIFHHSEQGNITVCPCYTITANAVIENISSRSKGGRLHRLPAWANLVLGSLLTDEKHIWIKTTLHP